MTREPVAVAGDPADDPERLLDALDTEQRTAAETLLGPVCILAGAGTGKTRAITHRIAYGVATGAYTPQRVMALTFTARAAGELRNRLRMLGAGTVAARTFHSAALSQLNYFWPLVVGGSAPAVLDGKGRLLGQAAERIHLKVDTATLRDVAAEIEWRKVSELGIDEYGRALDGVPGVPGSGRPTPGRLSVDQAVSVQQAYEDLKDERKQIDFEDVLLACAGMIETEASVSMHVREQYRFFVVDEFQDVSPLQHRLLQLWLGDRTELCVVGDASQTIYSFAGASSSFLLDFGREHPDAEIVRLERNYRSAAPIVETANRLMRGRAGALTLHPVAPAEKSPDSSQASAHGVPDAAVAPAPSPHSHAPVATEPSISEHTTDIAEARAVAAAIVAEIEHGRKPQDIAVLYRMNVQAAAIETALTEADVSYQLRGGRRFFDLPEVRQAVMQLRAASVAIAGEPLFKSVSDVLRSLGWTQAPPATRGAVRDRWESLNALMGLVDQVKPGTSFRRFTDELLERQAAQHEPAIAAVTLATLHSAKGLEWESVHIVGLSEGLVPIGYAVTESQIDEERRLLYVGITRARANLRLSWAVQGPQRAARRAPSRFLAELGSRNRRAAGALAR